MNRQRKTKAAVQRRTPKQINRSDLDHLLSNLIDPRSEVGRDFRMSANNLQDGRKITGIVVERTPARIVVQTATERTVIAGEDVESVKDSLVSIMPEGQLDALQRKRCAP